jgi:hypothetical protein
MGTKPTLRRPRSRSSGSRSIARGWRCEAVRASGFGFVAIGVAVLVARTLAGDVVSNDRAATCHLDDRLHELAVHPMLRRSRERAGNAERGIAASGV